MAMEGTMLAGKYPSGMVKYNVPVAMPKTFQESPMLAALVRAGKLPPVEQRLPEEPRVVAPVAIGEYGGTWRRVYTWNGDHAYIAADQLISWDGDGQTAMPRVAKTMEFSDGGRVVTITLRRGHKFSDGQPFTAEAFKWTWEALHTNEEYTPVLPSSYKSPLTKNPPKLEVLDDLTVRYTWDDPNYAILDSNGGLTSPMFSNRARALYTSAPYLKQFHPDYADKAELDRMIQDAEVDNWVDLMKIKVHAYRNEELPGLNAWLTVDGSEGGEWIKERNPYYFEVDTAGNQLPYIDRVHMTLVEDLETVGLKAAGGEVDFQGRHMTLAKVPVFLKDADRTNVHMTFWPCPCPTDAAINLNNSFVQDPLIGELLRIRDFRIALSIGMDREEIKETFFLGMGQTRSYVPEKGTAYYPGDEYLFKNAVTDVKKANALLDGIVLKDGSTISKRNSAGIRLRPDNGQQLELKTVTLAAYAVDYGRVSELLNRQWEENLGIKGNLRETRNAARDIQNNDEYIFIWETGGGQSPWLYPYWTVPWHQAFRAAVEVGRYYDTGGAKGEPGDSPKYANPEGEFPLLTLQLLFDEGKTHPLGSPERIRVGQEIYKIHTKEMYVLPTVGSTPLMKGTFVTKDNFKGAPEFTRSGTALHNQGPMPETYYFEGGKNDAGF